MDDKLSFLDGDDPAEPTDAPVEVAPEVATEPQGPERDDKGRFASKEPAPEPVPEPQPEAVAAAPEPAPQATPAAQPEPQRPPDGYVPLEALQSVRRELQEFKQQMQQRPAPPPEPAPVAPDPYDDPAGYVRFQEAQVGFAVQNTRFDFSEEMAREKHGDDAVNAAIQWAQGRYQASPAFYQEVLGQRNPYGFVLTQFRQAQLLEQLSDPAELQAFQQWKASQGQAQAQPAPQPAAALAAPPPNPQAPPRSLAAAPNAGGTKPGEQPVGPGVGFDSLFGA